MTRVIFQVSLDGSYGRNTPGKVRVFSYGGLFGYEDAWKAFAPGWQGVLAMHQIERYRTHDLKVRPDFEDIRSTLATAAHQCGLKAVGCSADVALLDDVSEARKKKDVFEHVVKQLLRAAPPEVNFALICDREQDLAKQVAAWLQRLSEMGRPNSYDRIAGICYMNSEHSLQTQAADLVAGLFREHAERQLAVPGAEVDKRLVLLTGDITNRLGSRSEFLAE